VSDSKPVVVYILYGVLIQT